MAPPTATDIVVERTDALKRLKDLKLRAAKIRNGRMQYEHDNKLEFFGILDEKRSLDHGSCCKLGRGPNPVQSEILKIWGDQSKKVFVLTGANRIGKTTILSVVALSVLFGKWLWDGKELTFPHKHPRKVRYVGQDWEKHIKTVVEPSLDYWWPKKRKLKTHKNNFGVDSMWEDEETGSTLEIMSNNQDSDLHEGWDGDLVCYDEPPKRDIRVANARGLVDRLGREFFGMTLLKEAWVDREVIKAVDDQGNPDTSVFAVNADISVNVGFGITKEGVDQFSKTLRPEEREARIFGKPSYMSGIIYAKFNRRPWPVGHLKKRHPIPLDWMIDIGIDFHPSKKWAVLFMATTPQNFKGCIDEIWQNGSWKAIGEEIVRRCKSESYRVGKIIIDPLSKGDEQSDLHEESVFRKMQDLFATYDYSMYAASKDKEGGIHLVQNLLWTENEMPGIFFFDDLRRTIYEIEGYMIDPVTGKPSKEDDDMMENLYRLTLLNTDYDEPKSIYNRPVTELMAKTHSREGWYGG